jgi:hypothetical protein
MTNTFVIGLILLTSSIALAQEAKTVASPVLSLTAYSNRTTSNPHHLKIPHELQNSNLIIFIGCYQ